MEAEFAALGLDFSQRAAMTDEYLQVLKLAWTQDRLTFRGQFVSCRDVVCEPKPVHRPHPPVWLGGDSDGAFRRVARFADGWHGLLGSPGARQSQSATSRY